MLLSLIIETTRLISTRINYTRIKTVCNKTNTLNFCLANSTWAKISITIYLKKKR